MNKLKKGKMEKGITLIALIITIIVLLILAIVTIGAIKNDGLIQYAQNARKDYTDAANKEQEDLNTLLGKIEGNAPGNNGEGVAGGNKTPISKTETYIGYYADVDGNGSVDGIIYADLAKDGSGEWGNYEGFTPYSYSKKETLNNYYISQEKYKHKEFAEKPVIAPIDKVEENDRFYVMALEDFTTEDYTTFYWYYNADGIMSDYATTTSEDFGKGKENTKIMMSKLYGDGLKDQDMWKYIGDEVSKGWFVPSNKEWSAFGVFANGQGMTTENCGNYGLSEQYWSSLQTSTFSARIIYIRYGFMYSAAVTYSLCVRLSTTF